MVDEGAEDVIELALTIELEDENEELVLSIELDTEEEELVLATELNDEKEELVLATELDHGEEELALAIELDDEREALLSDKDAELLGDAELTAEEVKLLLCKLENVLLTALDVPWLAEDVIDERVDVVMDVGA